jgi:hypothetical protein
MDVEGKELDTQVNEAKAVPPTIMQPDSTPSAGREDDYALYKDKFFMLTAKYLYFEGKRIPITDIRSAEVMPLDHLKHLPVICGMGLQFLVTLGEDFLWDRVPLPWRIAALAVGAGIGYLIWLRAPKQCALIVFDQGGSQFKVKSKDLDHLSHVATFINEAMDAQQRRQDDRHADQQ